MTARVARGPDPEAPRLTAPLIEAGALWLLVVTPLVHGAVEPWAEAVAGLVVLGMAALWVLGMITRGELEVVLPPGWLPGMLFLTLVLLQAVPLPAAVVEWLSPLSGALHREASAYTGGGSSAGPLSLDPHATRREALKLLTVAVFFLVCSNTLARRTQVQRALWTMIVTGTVVSIFGLVQRATWTGRLYWIGPEAPGSAFGPFVNRAHFAGLMVVIVPMALALVLAARPDRDRAWRGRGWADRLRRWGSAEAGPARLIAFLVLLMGGATLASGSRGGAVSLIAALLAMVGLGATGRSGPRRAARVGAATALIVLSGAWIGSDILYGTVERLAREVGRPAESVRAQLWGDALALWRESPVVGTGLATFEVAFPHVRTLEAPVIFTHAESDWVQLLTDTGVLGPGLALAVAGALVVALLRQRREAASPRARHLALAGLVALVGTVVQGIGNFSLPVTSNWLYLALAVVLALGVEEEPGAAMPPRDAESPAGDIWNGIWNAGR